MGLENPPQQKELPADYIENDPRLKAITEEASLDYLKAEDGDWFRKNYSGNLSDEGYLIDRSGKETNLKPSMNVTAGFGKVAKMARDEFGLRFPDEAQEYANREKVRIYDRPESDPALRVLDEEITRRTNEDSMVRNASGKRSGLDGHGEVWKRVHFRESMHAYDRFISAFPEKATAYAAMNPQVQKAFERVAGMRERDRIATEMASEPQIEELTEGAPDIQPASEPLPEQGPEVSAEISSPVAESKPESAPAQQAEPIPEKASLVQAKPENIPDKKAILENYLSYQDSVTSPEEKLAMREWSEKSESAGKYAESLRGLFSKVPQEKVEERASAMVMGAKTVLDKIGVVNSKHAGSKSWAMWDIGKQYHYFTHPDEATEGYYIADPIESKEKSQEIVDRHIGWEIFHTKDKSALDKFKAHPFYQRIMQYLNKAPKANKDLSSKDLAALGQLVRRMTEMP